MPLTLEIVTPEAVVYSQTVDKAVIHTESGEIGLLPGHIPLLTIVKPGELHVEKNGKIDYLAVDHGYAEVVGDHIRVLTEAAIDIEDYDIHSAAEAEKRAQEALKEAQDSGEDPELLARLERQARFAVIQKLMKQNRS